MSTDSRRHIPPMRVLIMQEQGVFVARCLEFNIAAHGRTHEEARRAFAEALIRHVLAAEQCGRDPFDSPRSTRTPYHELWDRGQREGASPSSLVVPAFTTRWKDQTQHVEAASVKEIFIPAA